MHTHDEQFAALNYIADALTKKFKDDPATFVVNFPRDNSPFPMHTYRTSITEMSRVITINTRLALKDHHPEYLATWAIILRSYLQNTNRINDQTVIDSLKLLSLYFPLSNRCAATGRPIGNKETLPLTDGYLITKSSIRKMIKNNNYINCITNQPFSKADLATIACYAKKNKLIKDATEKAATVTSILGSFITFSILIALTAAGILPLLILGGAGAIFFLNLIIIFAVGLDTGWHKSGFDMSGERGKSPFSILWHDIGPLGRGASLFLFPFSVVPLIFAVGGYYVGMAINHFKNRPLPSSIHEDTFKDNIYKNTHTVINEQLPKVVEQSKEHVARKRRVFTGEREVVSPPEPPVNKERLRATSVEQDGALTFSRRPG